MNSREVILKALYRVEKDGAYSNKALNDALNGVSTADKAFVTGIFYGVLKSVITLDYIIMQFSNIKLKKTSPWVKNILRMGVYQIYYMDKIPDSAACNESVKLAKKYSHQASVRFVNGVLRNISRNKENIEFPDRGDIVKYLMVKYSYPEWIVNKFIGQFDEDECEKILEESNLPHPVTIRANTLKISADELAVKLEESGISAEVSTEVQNCLTIDGKIDVNKTQIYREGLFSLQNKSSMLTVETLDPQSGEFIIDVCAAPGGKSAYIAELMGNKGKVLSFDIYEHKAKLIRMTAQRLGINIIEERVHNSEVCDLEFKEKADRVLVDAPCSGLGVIHRKPDIKFNRKPEDIEELSKIQLRILKASSRYVKRGGILLYSVCTVLVEEGGEVVKAFLNENSGNNDFKFEVMEEKLLLTHKMGGSGFYICKMRRK